MEGFFGDIFIWQIALARSWSQVGPAYLPLTGFDVELDKNSITKLYEQTQRWSKIPFYFTYLLRIQIKTNLGQGWGQLQTSITITIISTTSQK